MKRNLELTLPDEQPGAHIAFGIMLATKSVGYQREGGLYKLKDVPYEMVQHIADDAFSLFPIGTANFLDVEAGLHFGLERRFSLRRTGP